MPDVCAANEAGAIRAMRTREEQVKELSRLIQRPLFSKETTTQIACKYILEAEARGIATIKSSTKTAQEDERLDIRKWQEDQKEWFDPTIREIVAEYAAWRDQQDHSQALKQESLSNKAEQRVRAEMARELKNPECVHVNMLRGEIAAPSWGQLLHLFPKEYESIRRDSERLDWLGKKFRSCIVYMNGERMFMPGPKVRNLKGHDFREAIDKAREVE